MKNMWKAKIDDFNDAITEYPHVMFLGFSLSLMYN
jgi:hypothetical protein